MKKINVIDLDNTLIPYDSFRVFVINKIRSGNISVIFYTILRKIRFLSLAEYKRRVILSSGFLNDSKTIDKIVDRILQSINPRIMKVAKENTDDNTLNILCSASPDVYVKKVAQQLNWIGYGSYFKNKYFIHLWGHNKLTFIKSNYPVTDYIYNFAISDSKRDLELIKQFKFWLLLN